MDQMTSTELSRLIDWLESKGMTDADIVECIRQLGKKNRLPRADQSKGSLNHSRRRCETCHSSRLHFNKHQPKNQLTKWRKLS